jgi:hypothetical protein
MGHFFGNLAPGKFLDSLAELVKIFCCGRREALRMFRRGGMPYAEPEVMV